MNNRTLHAYTTMLLCFITLMSCKEETVGTDAVPVSSQQIDTSWVQNPFFQNRYVGALDVAFGRHLYTGAGDAGTWSFPIYRSTDRGNSWQLVGNGLDGTLRGVASGMNGNVYAITDWNSPSGLFRSADSGLTWLSCEIADVAFYAVRTNSRGHVFASTKGAGVFRSTDNGQSWDQIRTGLGYYNAYTTIAVMNPNTILMGGDGLYRSIDNGDSWTVVDSVGSFVWDLTTRSASIVFAATDQGLFASTDSGATWTRKRGTFCTCVAINARGDIFIGSENLPGVLRSSDNGSTWMSFGFSHRRAQTLAVESEGFLYAVPANETGLYETMSTTLQ